MKTSKGQTTSCKKKFLGSIFMLSGTSLGAGTIILPVMIAKCGIIFGFILMVMIWLIALFASMLILDITKSYGSAVTMSHIYKKTMPGKIFMLNDIAAIFLMYILLSAYISAGATLLQKSSPFPQVANEIYIVIFTVLMALFAGLCTKIADYSNRVFFAIKLILFFVMIYMLLENRNGQHLSFAINYCSAQNISFVVPILFCAFGFHGSASFIIKYMGIGQYSAIKKVFVISSVVPMTLYSIFAFVVLYALPYTSGLYNFSNVFASDNRMDVFIHQLNNITNYQNLSFIIDVFALFAIITSFIGVGSAMLHHLNEKVLKKKEYRNTKRGFALTFSVPFLIALLYPNLFLSGLSFAAVALVIIAIILPSLAAYYATENNTMKCSTAKASFILLNFFFGICIIIAKCIS